MRTRRLVPFGLLVVGVIGLGVGGRVVVEAFNPQPEPPGLFYPAMSVLPGETAQVYVTNVEDPQSARGRAFADAAFEVSFYDEVGSLLVQRVETVGPKRTVAVGFTGGGRMPDLVWAQVRLVSGDAPFVSNLEVFGSSGAMSRFVHPLTLVGFNPQPEPPGLPR